ncbi:helix-turn-helix domain-containing protein [Streptomyces venezuelae]|uniref:helix-turn-helix domain-containing protein n=1 Tax=Streptomyces venezuelae TaxID=54571 RepID=UPI001683F7CE|nr:helix-turn-helix transcriptional regulator [Streptomyces venezuelae]
MTAGRHTPDPRGARTPAEFLARLQALKDWSGLTYRELAARAESGGDVLPRSTVANMLARTTLPREELLTAFVRACGATREEEARWRTVRNALAGRAGHGQGDAGPAEPGEPGAWREAADGAEAWGPAVEPGPGGSAKGPADPGSPTGLVTPGDLADPADDHAGQHTPAGSGTPAAPTGPGTPTGSTGPGTPTGSTDPARPSGLDPDRAEVVASAGGPPVWPTSEGGSGEPVTPPARIRRAVVAVIAVAGLVLAGVSVVALLREGHQGHPGHSGQPTRTGAPVAGGVRIRVAGTELCLAERRGTRTGQIHQVPCAEAGVPLYSLAEVGGGRWRIVSDHPDFGPGCSGIPSGGRIPDAPYEDSECGDPSRVEAFALEPYGTPVRGYRIVPAGSATPGSCVTVVGDRAAPWARLAQAPCAPDASGQLFSFERRP